MPLIFLWCLFFSLLPLPLHAQDQTPSQLVGTVQSCLVEIRATDTKTFDEGHGQTRIGTYQAQGSGVIIDPDGLIVTNTHIVAHASRILVGFSDGSILQAKVVYSSDADFSFLKVDTPYPLRSIRWADSSLAQTGTPVIALTTAEDNNQHILGGQIINLVNGASSNTVELFELNLELVHGDSGGPPRAGPCPPPNSHVGAQWQRGSM